MLPVYRFLRCIGHEILYPAVQAFRHGQDVGNFLIRKQVGLLEVPLCQAHMIFAALPAGITRLAEAAPFAGAEFAFARIGQERFGAHLHLCPAQQLVLLHFVGGQVVQPGLHDGHAYMVDIVERIKFQQRAQGIEHELTVAIGVYSYAATALEIDYLDHAIRHDDNVAGSEALRHVLAVIQPVLHHDQRIRTGGADRLDGFNAEGDVFIRDAFGLVRIKLAVTMFRILRFHTFHSHIAQVAVQLQLAQLMQIRALFRVGRRLILELLGELDRRRAHHPAVGRGSVETGVGAAGVLNFTHSAATSFLTASYWLS